MKSTMLLMMLSWAAHFHAAADEPEFKVFKIPEPNAYRVIYARPASGVITLEIMNGRKQTLYRSVYHATRGIKLPLDLSELQTGKYYVSVRDGKNFFEQAIDHVHETRDVIFHAAPLVSDAKKYLVSIITPSHSSVTLSVYDAHGKTLYQQYNIVRAQEALVLNLEKFTGPFVFELTDATGKKREVWR